MSLLARGLAKIGLYPTGGHLVKRVIGVAGDTIECCDDQGRLMVNGQPIDEDDFIEPQKDPPKSCDGPMPSGQMDCNWTAGPVPAGTVFVMGDNRNDSADSSRPPVPTQRHQVRPERTPTCRSPTSSARCSRWPGRWAAPTSCTGPTRSTTYRTPTDAAPRRPLVAPCVQPHRTASKTFSWTPLV